MGCGASKNDVIKASTTSVTPKTNDTSNGNNMESMNSTSSVRSETSTIPANDYYQNNLNNESDGSMTPLEKAPMKPPRSNLKGELNETKQLPKLSRPEPVAFEVPAEDEDMLSESLIKRHPPKRLQKTIEEQQQLNDAPALTQEQLKEKVELANERRSQVLYKRVASARQKSARVINRSPEQLNHAESNGNGYGGNLLQNN